MSEEEAGYQMVYRWGGRPVSKEEFDRLWNSPGPICRPDPNAPVPGSQPKGGVQIHFRVPS